jgi:hypothetical protein
LQENHRSPAPENAIIGLGGAPGWKDHLATLKTT